MQVDAAVLAETYGVLVRAAASSKRTLAENRRLLRSQLRAIDNLEAEAARLGLTLTTDTDRGGQSHGS